MTLNRNAILWLGLVAVASIAITVVSCSSLGRPVLSPPSIEGASFVGNKTCAECHANVTRVFPSSPHARIHLDDAKMAGQTGCESCHGPGSKHVAAGGGRGKFIINPAKDPTTCFQCHLQTQAEFNLPQHHPVLEGKMNCVQCHDPCVLPRAVPMVEAMTALVLVDYALRQRRSAMLLSRLKLAQTKLGSSQIELNPSQTKLCPSRINVSRCWTKLCPRRTKLCLSQIKLSRSRTNVSR